MNPSSPSTACTSDQGNSGSVPAWLRLGVAAVVVAGALGLGTRLVRARPGRGPVETPAEQARAEAQAQAKSKKVVVPFEMLPTNHMMVRARINGEGPYRLIFDLGAPITLLSNRASEAAGVVKPDAPRWFLLGMRGEAEIDRLQAGDLTVTKLPVIVFDHPVLQALGELVGRRIDGIVGFTLFARYRTTIDYQAHQMTFEPVDYQIRDLLKELPDRMLGPKVARHRVLAAAGLWGIQLGEPTGGLDAPGVPVTAVEEGSPAAQGGLRPGDVITTLDGRWTASIADVFAAAADVEPGRAAAVVILRDGQEMTRTVTPADGA
jgi:hypothetical protein